MYIKMNCTWDFFTNEVTPAIGAAEAATFYNNVIVFAAGQENCAGHNAESGSMGAWGGPEGSGYAFCRMDVGGTACPASADPHGTTCDPTVKYHIYVCNT